MSKTKPKFEDETDEVAAAPVAAPAIAAVKDEPRRKLLLPASEIQPFGIKWETWQIVCLPDHTLEDVLDPGFLFAKGEYIKPMDTIEIKHPLGIFTIVLDVQHVDMRARGIVAHIRHLFDYTQEARTIRPRLANAKIMVMGDNGWSVVEDHHVIADGFRTKAEADRWLDAKRAGGI